MNPMKIKLEEAKYTNLYSYAFSQKGLVPELMAYLNYLEQSVAATYWGVRGQISDMTGIYQLDMLRASAGNWAQDFLSNALTLGELRNELRALEGRMVQILSRHKIVVPPQV